MVPDVEAGREKVAAPQENYEKYFVPTIGEPLAADLVAAAELKPGERVLDVACGTGLIARLAAKQVGSNGFVAGLDVNSGMLAVARSLEANPSAIKWYETSAEAIPLEDAAFDVVLCQMGLQFVTKKAQALKEMRRVLRRGGRLLLNLPGPMPPLFAELASSLGACVGPKASGFVNVVFSLHDRNELHDLMVEAGFESVEIEKTEKRLALPEPREFLRQYVGSTPLAPHIDQASDSQRKALADDVEKRWQRFLLDRTLTVDVPMTTVRGS